MSEEKKVGSGWDPNTYVYNYPYNTEHYYSYAPRQTAFEIPGAVKWANISFILSILGIICPIFVFSLVSARAIERYNKVSHNAKLDRVKIAKKLCIVGGILSIIVFPIAFIMVVRYLLMT